MNHSFPIWAATSFYLHSVFWGGRTVGRCETWPWLDIKCSSNQFIMPLLNWTGKRKYSKRLEGWEIPHKRPSPANQPKLRKVHLIYWQIRVGNWEIKTSLPSSLPSSLGSTLLLISQLYLLPSSVAQEDGEWGLQSVCHTLSLLLLAPHEEDTHFCSVGSGTSALVPGVLDVPRAVPLTHSQSFLICL